MKILKLILVFSILPFLTGCATYYTLKAVDKPTTRTLPDRVDHIEKVVISKDNQLLIFFDGCLTNSSQKGRFTLAVSLAQIQTNADIYGLLDTNGTIGKLRVSRNAIHADWMPQEISVGNLKTVPVGSPIPAAGFQNCEAPGAYAESAKLLPNTTQTLYPIIEYGAFNPNGWPAKMEFIYLDATAVDTTAKRAYTIIAVDQPTITIKKHRGYYCLLPLTVPADIATFPLQVVGAGIGFWYMATHSQ